MNTLQDFYNRLRPNAQGCLEYTMARDKNGYGLFNYKNKLRKTHRFAYELKHGAIPRGMYVCHTCDNPPCCNPDHLFLGTQQDNMKDRKQKNRTNWKPGINTIRKQQNLPLL